MITECTEICFIINNVTQGSAMDLPRSCCRLCAVSKVSNNVINLQTDAAKRSEIMEKLIRLNAATDFDNYLLPKTVCLDCISSLNNAYDFVSTVENAQSTLNQIFKVPVIKKEKFKNEETGVENKTEELNCDVTVKKESDEDLDNDSGGFDHDTNSYQEMPRKYKKAKSKLIDIDSIPLSQLSQLITSWKNYNWYCTFCECLFTSIDELQKHSMSTHSICNPYRCTDCKVRKMMLDKFLDHVQRHNKYLKYSCYICFEQFRTTIESKKHRATHFKSKFICPGCNNTFISHEEFKKHNDDFCQVRRVRKLPLMMQTDGLTCKICKKTYKTKSSLHTHLIIHTDRKNEHTCDVCGKGFFLKNNLEAHMVIHNDDRPHKCQICNATFKTKRLLKNHVGVHTTDKPFTCDECGRSFRLRKQLESHSIIHTDIHPYSCQHCQKRFRFKSILNSHVRLHTGVRPYSCEPCQREFTNWSNYNKHMKRKHNTDTSKKKHTPDGLYPIDPKTGDILIKPETNKIKEWKEKMLLSRGQGRHPKESEPKDATNKNSDILYKELTK